MRIALQTTIYRFRFRKRGFYALLLCSPGGAYRQHLPPAAPSATTAVPILWVCSITKNKSAEMLKSGGLSARLFVFVICFAAQTAMNIGATTGRPRAGKPGPYEFYRSVFEIPTFTHEKVAVGDTGSWFQCRENFIRFNPSVTASPCHLPLHKGGFHKITRCA